MAFHRQSYDVWHPSTGSINDSNMESGITDGYAADTRIHQPNGEAKKSQPEEEERGNWGNKAEFILSCIGMSVGLGNVWRFPYLAYANGGAAFVIAYLILQLVIGKPLYFMELCMGQFSGRGPTQVWAMNPAAKGIGIGMCMAALIAAIYYNVIMAYTLFFFFASMQSNLPWTYCTDEWVEKYNCTAKRARPPPFCTGNNTYNEMLDECLCTGNSTIDPFLTVNCTVVKTNVKTAAELYFERVVIEKSAGLDPDNIGIPLYKLALLLLLSWIIVIVCLIKGIKSSGKVVYFTATFPYVILIILLIRGCLVDGAVDGIEFFIVPEWKKMADLSVWTAAAGQMFFSLGIAFGAIIVFGSYNKFDNQVYYDSLLISIMDLITSLISGFVIFSSLGGLAKAVGVDVSEVARASYGLAFVVYPEALSNIPPPQLWSVLFFFMLFTLGLDSEFAFMETALTGLHDEFPFTRKKKSYICVGAGIACYFLALPCVCPGGDYVVAIMDHYGTDFSLLFLACFEVISVMWVYGAMRFLKDIEYMLGEKPHGWPYWIACWCTTCPVLIALLITYRMIQYTPPMYDNGEPFPDFAQSIGWALLSCVLCPVPLCFVYRLIKAICNPACPTFMDKVHFMFSPTPLWLPNDGRERYLLPEGATPGQAYPMKDEEKGYDNPIPVNDKFS